MTVPSSTSVSLEPQMALCDVKLIASVPTVADSRVHFKSVRLPPAPYCSIKHPLYSRGMLMKAKVRQSTSIYTALKYFRQTVTRIRLLLNVWHGQGWELKIEIQTNIHETNFNEARNL